jgi:hypothetical protein
MIWPIGVLIMMVPTEPSSSCNRVTVFSSPSWAA